MQDAKELSVPWYDAWIRTSIASSHGQTALWYAQKVKEPRQQQAVSQPVFSMHVLLNLLVICHIVEY